MNPISKSLKAIFDFVLIFASIYCVGSITGCSDSTPKEITESVCQDTRDAAKVKCTGTCLSDAEGPNCYVSFRRAGSEDDWEYSGFSTLDRTPGIEYDCYCYK